jgi:EmrB/QacA subfamily drug resistance transporter
LSVRCGVIVSDGGDAGVSGRSRHNDAGLDPALVRLSLVVILGAIMSILDTTIVNVAIDTLAHEFHSPLSTIQWVSTGYLLALSIVIPLSGWSVERFGAKRMWILSLSVFLVGSILSGAAWSASSLIFFRVIQGIGGGMILPIGTSMMAQAAGPQRIGRVMSILGVPMLLAPILGPVIGGLIVTSVSWRWIFYFNVPIGIVAIVVAVRMLPTERIDSKPRLDLLGLLLLSPGLASVVYGLSQLGSSGSTSSVAVALSIGVMLIAAFALHAARRSPGRDGKLRPEPLIDIHLFGDRSFLPAALTSFGFGAALFGALILLPLYYQVDRGDSALVAGLLIAPQGIGAALVMPSAGRLADRLGPGRIVPIGLVIVILGTLAYTMVGASTSYAFLAGALFVRGIGFGFTMMPAIAAAYQNLDHAQVPRATAAINILQRVGGSIGTALLAVILERQIAAALPGGGSAVTTGGTSISPDLREKIAPQIAAAFGHTFWWAVGIAVLALVPALFLSRKPAIQVSLAAARAAPVSSDAGPDSPGDGSGDRSGDGPGDGPGVAVATGPGSRRHRKPRHSAAETLNRSGEN